jgi:hypothetical protein
MNCRMNKILSRRSIVCPACGERIFQTPRLIRFDSRGVETYELRCNCGLLLSGIVDPADGALQLSAKNSSY